MCMRSHFHCDIPSALVLLLVCLDLDFFVKIEIRRVLSYAALGMRTRIALLSDRKFYNEIIVNIADL